MSDNAKTTASRRQVVRAAAWTAPVIVLGTAAPAFAFTEGDLVITTGLPSTITGWRGDHHFGTATNDLTERDYDFTVTVTDRNGVPLSGATVVVTVSGQSQDGDILSVGPYPAPESDGPEDDPQRSQTLLTGTGGTARFSVKTQDLSDDELPGRATMTVSVTYNGITVTQTYTVIITVDD